MKQARDSPSGVGSTVAGRVAVCVVDVEVTLDDDLPSVAVPLDLQVSVSQL